MLKSRFWAGPRMLWGACALLAVGVRVQAAQWGSIRANNRAGHEETRGVGGERREHEAIRPREERRDREREEPARVEPRFEGRREEIRVPERRFSDFDEDRRRVYFWSGITAGTLYGQLPSGYVSLNVGGNPYYYYQGAYYEPAQSGYVAVTPPLGAVVPTLPLGAESVPVGQSMYYYAGGAFYAPGPQGLVVVAPPLGVTVSSLPPGAVPVYIRGGLYYQAGGVYFMPSMQAGVTVYTTVQP